MEMSQDFETSDFANSSPEHDLASKEIDLEGRGCGHGGTADDASVVSDLVGHQIEIERANTIKYRTCSWQKVGMPSVNTGTGALTL